MTALVLPDMCQLMNQPNFVGYAGLSEIFGAVFTRKVYVSIGRNGGIGVGYKWNAAIYFDAVEVYAVRKNLFCHTDFIFCQSAPIGKNHILKNDRG
mgnify:CR=1 FL=1